MSDLLNAKYSDAYTLLGRMEVILQSFKGNPKYHHFVPFLETYYLVTKKVVDKISKEKSFNNTPALVKLDVIFASMYFKPLQGFISKKTKSAPWTNYLSYCSKKSSTSFVQMITGINAHINGDLPIALLKTGYTEEKDFFLINNILKSVIPEVFSYLSFDEKDIYGISGLILQKLVLEEFNKIVVKWRKNAWNNYQKMRSMSAPQRKVAERKLKFLTEEVTLKLCKSFENAHPITNPPAFFEEMHSIEVVL
jgi:hypothetical protein